MRKTRLSLHYLAGYTLFGGLGFFAMPMAMLQLFGATGEYDEVMVRFVGLLLVAIGILVTQMIRHHLTQLYATTLLVRLMILTALIWFYVRHEDPLMMVLLFIVGLGFVLTATGYAMDRKAEPR